MQLPQPSGSTNGLILSPETQVDSDATLPGSTRPSSTQKDGGDLQWAQPPTVRGGQVGNPETPQSRRSPRPNNAQRDQQHPWQAESPVPQTGSEQLSRRSPVLENSRELPQAHSSVLESGQEPPIPQQRDISRTHLEAKTRPHFWIIHRSPSYVERSWPGGDLKRKSLSAFFDDIANETGRTDIRQIRFLLCTPKIRIECDVSRGDEPCFEDMLERFCDEVRNIKRSGRKCQLSVLVEPDPPASFDQIEAQMIQEEEEEDMPFGYGRSQMR